MQRPDVLLPREGPCVESDPEGQRQCVAGRRHRSTAADRALAIGRRAYPARGDGTRGNAGSGIVSRVMLLV